MQTAYHAESIVDAQIVKDALDAAGIPAFIAGAALIGGMGQLPARDFIRVLVPDSALPQALDVIAEVFPDRVSPDASRPAGDAVPVAGRRFKPA